MIQKTIKIRSIGMLDTLEAVALQPITIVYGENGCGKTTLAGILRSLTTGDPRPIRAKQRFASTQDPHASFLISGQRRPITFDGDAWDGPGPEIEIFDRQFVDQNVHIGPRVEHAHKQALHGFVIGRAGVELDERVRQLDDEIVTLRVEMRDLAAEIQRHAHGDMPADEVAKLPRDDEIDVRIAEQERVLRAAEAADRIASRPAFATVEIEALELDGLRALLGRSLAEVSEAAAERTWAHITTHLDEHGETWLSDGMGYVDGPTCPFCGADLSGNTLIEAFQAYFSDAYRGHLEAIEAMADAFERLYSEADAERLARRIDNNAELAAFWSYVGIDAPANAPDVDEVKRLYASLRAALGKEIERKRSVPLEALAPREETLLLAEQLERVRERAAAYNDAVGRANEAIERVKRETRSAAVSEEKRTLDRLLNQRDRYRDPLKNLCGKYSAKGAARAAKEEEKASKKEELDRYSAEWFTRYQDRLNRHLASSGCAFRIEKTKTRFLGGKPRVDYVLVIHGTEVDPTPSGSAGPEEPHFGNTLSEGDKSALAFGFFLAKLDLDPDLANKIVVFDDPMTSLDRNRRNYTAEQILRVAGRCKQVIVLTHDLTFAWEIWAKADRSARQSLQIERIGADRSVLRAWDIEEAVRDGYFADYDRLRRFYDGSGSDDRLLVVRSIRTALEEHYRRRFPGEVLRSSTLGEILGSIRTAEAPSPLAIAKREYETLNSVNDFVTRYEHGRDSQPGQTDIPHAELRTYVSKALALIHGAPVGDQAE